MKKLLISLKLSVSCQSTINLTSLRLNIPVILGILLLSWSAWNSCLWVSALQISENLPFCRSKRILICSFSESVLGFPLTLELSEPNSSTSLSVLTWQTDNDGLGNKLSSRVMSMSTARWFFSLLNEQWWRERSADGVVTNLRVMQVRGLVSLDCS